MKFLKTTKQLLAGIVAVTFFITNTLTPAPTALAMSFGALAAKDVELLSSSQSLNIPVEWGHVTDLEIMPQPSALIVHIREAHANYDAQKNIQKILRFLNKNYGIKLVLLEGAGNRVHPELFQFFPKDKELDQAINEGLLKRGDLTGAEIFLANTHDQGTEGHGVEDVKSYIEDREAFRKVFKARSVADDFLKSVYLTWQKQAGRHLNKDLREFLLDYTAFKEEKVPLQDWLEILRQRVRKSLNVDLQNIGAQFEWPVLVRYFRLRAIDGVIDQSELLKEKKNFLNEAATHLLQNSRPSNQQAKFLTATPEALLKQAEALLATGANQDLPIHQTRFIFEKMIDLLPVNYSFEPFPNLRLYIQQLILLSELQGDRLQEEIEGLTKKTVEALIQNENEKRYTRLLREYQLLKKLFYLELSREEFQQIQARQITPGDLIARLQTTDQRLQTKNNLASVFSLQSSVSPLDSLFRSALDFYQGAVDRENWMMYNAVEKMRQREQSRAVLITGGFHTDGIKDRILESRSSYVQITPTIGEIRPEDEKNYLKALLGPRAMGHGPRPELVEQAGTHVAPATIPLAGRRGSWDVAQDQIGSPAISDIPFLFAMGPAYVAARRSEMRETGRQVIASERPEEFDELFPGYEQQLAKIFQAADEANTRFEEHMEQEALATAHAETLLNISESTRSEVRGTDDTGYRAIDRSDISWDLQEAPLQKLLSFFGVALMLSDSRSSILSASWEKLKTAVKTQHPTWHEDLLKEIAARLEFSLPSDVRALQNIELLNSLRGENNRVWRELEEQAQARFASMSKADITGLEQLRLWDLVWRPRTQTAGIVNGVRYESGKKEAGVAVENFSGSGGFFNLKEIQMLGFQKITPPKKTILSLVKSKEHRVACVIRFRPFLLV